MVSNTLTQWYDRLTGLLRRLPKELHGPILRELSPVREFFLVSRPPRIVFVQGDQAAYPQILKDLCHREFRRLGEIGGWTQWQADDGGRIDARYATDEKAVNSHAADLVFYMAAPASLPFKDVFLGTTDKEASLAPHFVFEAVESPFDTPAPEEGKREIALPQRKLAAATLAEAPDIICDMLPSEARLEMARISNARKSQKKIAETLLKSFAAICGVIGLQPIPLADLPVLTSLQTLLIGLIVHASGRKMGVRSVTEFLGALGLNLGIAFAFREGARAIVRFLPVWGSAVSGGVAAIGTYAIGKSAIAYFIEGLPQHEVRKLFTSLKNRRKPPALPPKNPALPQ
ncbi:MAG: hypothetical protein ABI615_09975 [Chthoniobacterales bacterium]